MNKKTKLIIFCQIVVVMLLAHTIILRGYVTNATKIEALLVEAKTFVYATEIIKTEIKNNLPEKIQDNIIEKAIVYKTIDYVITPKLVQEVSSKPIAKVIAAINKKGDSTIVNNKVVIDTTKYKAQLTKNISGWQLPKELNVLAIDVVSSLPPQVSIVNLEKNPNSFFAYIIKARIYVRELSNIITALTLVLAILIASIFVINRKKIVIAIRGTGWVLSFSGLFMIILSYIGSATVSSVFIVSNPTSVDNLVNNMVLAIGTNYLRASGIFGVISLIIGVIIIILTSPKLIDKTKKTIQTTKTKMHSNK